MSAEQIAAIYRHHAFNPRPIQEWFTATHVPFDQLFQTETIEARVASAACAGGRVAVVGRSGTGKTSLFQHALEDPNLLPVWMHVAVEEPALLVDPLSFGQLLITVIVNLARRYLRAADVDRSLAVAGERYERPGERRTGKRGGGVKTGWANVDLAKEITSADPGISFRVTASAVARSLHNLFAVIRSNGPMPVVVLDDSDRFLQVVSSNENSPDLFSPFVTRVLPWLTEFDCAKVVAVHPTYIGREEWVAARKQGLAGPEVHVPVLEEDWQLGEILSRRLQAFGIEATLKDVFADGTLQQLFAIYREPEPIIRNVLTLAEAAVVSACDQGSECVTPLHVDSARAELG